MWMCSKCKVQAADGTVVCGGCGTSAEGTEDPNYAKVKAEAGPFAVPSDEALKIAGLPAIEYLRGLESYLSNLIDGYDKPDWLVNPAFHPHVIAFIQSRANNAAFMGKARSLQDNRSRYYAAMKLRASQPPKPRTRKPIPRRPAASAAVAPGQPAAPSAPPPAARPVAQAPPARPPAMPPQPAAPAQARPVPRPDGTPRNDSAARPVAPPASAPPQPVPAPKPAAPPAPVARPQPAPLIPPPATAQAVQAPASVPPAASEQPPDIVPEEAPASRSLYIGLAVVLLLAAALAGAGAFFFVFN